MDTLNVYRGTITLCNNDLHGRSKLQESNLSHYFSSGSNIRLHFVQYISCIIEGIMSEEFGAGDGSGKGKRQMASANEDEDSNVNDDSASFKRVKRSNCKTMAEEYECHNLPIDPSSHRT